MNSVQKILLRITVTAGLLGFVVGGVLAVKEVMGARYVREFQAGEGSPLAERLVAIAQRGAIEGLGFALLGLVLGALSLGLASVGSGGPGAHPSGGRGQRAAAWLALSAAAFSLWVGFGAWFGNEALPFLHPGPLALLNVVGFLLCLAGFGIAFLAVRLMPFAARREPAALAIAAVVVAGVASLVAIRILKAAPNWRTAVPLGQAALCYVAAVPLGALLSRLIERPVAALGRRLADVRPLVPRALTWGLAALLAVCVAVTVPNLQLSATPAHVEYSALPGRGSPAGPNVVLITVDTLRADHLGCYGYERPTSPFLDSVAAEGTIFADACASAAWTKPATGTILTGLYPSRHGALYHGSRLQLPEGHRTLAETFRDAGYVTAGFVTNPNVKKVFDFDRGFDQFFDSPVEDTVTLAAIRGSLFGGVLMSLMRHQFNWNYENDVLQMNRHVLAWLRENRDQRFFLYLHYIDPHIPYAPPAPYEEQFRRDHGFVTFNRRKELVGVDLYDGEIRYTDDGLKQLVLELQALGLWEDTLFVLTSDHGEEFFEHGVLGHGFSLYQDVVHVPLIFRGPGVPAGRVVGQPVQILDMAATILDVAGVTADGLGDGRSFAESMRSPDWTAERLYFLENEFGTDDRDHRSFVFSGVRLGSWKLVLTERNANFPHHRGLQELYHLDQDPAEQRNLFQEEESRAVIERLTSELRAHAQHLLETGFRDIEPTVLSPEIEASLRALGYY